MTYAPAKMTDRFNTLPRMPSWVTSGRPETPEDVAFLSGAALSHLHLVLGHEAVPQALLRARLALRAAEVCVTHSGRVERAGELRDAVAFLQPGDHPGPAGETYLTWHRAAERPVAVQALQRALPNAEADRLAHWLDAGQGAPMARATQVLRTVLEDYPRDHTTALILADACLARSLGWRHVVPLLGIGLKRANLRQPDNLCDAVCHRAIAAAVIEVTREAASLCRRAETLRAVAPKLRAKGSDDTVAQFLAQDALSPMALTSLRSDRAARRFCDRLVDLGAVRELTGRDTFRLYGV